MAANRKALVELVGLVDKLKLRPEDLDGLVHDLKSGEASDINNGGIES